MWIEDISNFLMKSSICEICILRYTNADFHAIEHSLKAYDVTQNENKKRSKPNICFACLGIFQENIANEIVQNSNLSMYECDSIYSSISVPITILIHELIIWIELMHKFPEYISSDKSPEKFSVKDVFKNMLNKKLSEATNRNIEHDQNGILVNIVFDCDIENERIEGLLKVKPSTLKTNKKDRNRLNVTRNLFEKHFHPKNLNLEEFRSHFPLSCNTLSAAVNFSFSIVGPTIFVAGRYRKLSRDISQTPWILGGERMKEDSVQEIISREICPYFDVRFNNESVIFMASGREDVDVRCLGKGRPFILQILDAKKSALPQEVATKMELSLDDTKLVSVQHIQLVKRNELANIKSGEEHKKKNYRALCLLKVPTTPEIIHKLNIPNGFSVQQKTPLRVLHRRPLLTRPRQIFHVKGQVFKMHQNVVILDITTQAGSYVKELIHGDFGRTTPSISSIIGKELDIAVLDVEAIDLDWPRETSIEI